MSHEYYETYWITSKKQLEDLRNKDKILEETTNPLTDRAAANHLIGGLYAKYSVVVQQLTTCLDQICMAQKRETMRKLTDAAVIRLNEFKEMLVRINFSEYYYLDGNLLELKFIPHQIEILDPALFFDRPIHIEDLWIAIKNGETIYVPPRPPTPPESADKDTQAPAEEEEEGDAREDEEAKNLKKKAASEHKFCRPVVILSPEEVAEINHRKNITAAVLTIQNHERARQGRLYYGDLDIRRYIRKKIAYKLYKPDLPIDVRTDAAIRIQSVWRSHTERQQLWEREQKRRFVIGMTEPSRISTTEKNEFFRTVEERRLLRYERLREYIQASIDEKARVLRVIGPRLVEDISEEIREWFHTWYDGCRNFDKFPSVAEGGSILVVRGETKTPKEWIDEVAKYGRGGNRGKDAKAQKALLKKQEKERKKREKEARKREAAAQKGREARGELEIKFEQSIAASKFQDAFTEYKTLWDPRPDSDNPDKKHYIDLIQDKRYHELQMEIRQQVDELMRMELDLLNNALLKDTGKKPTPVKRAKPPKQKKTKDPTLNRTIEDMFQELVDNGIIHTYPQGKLSDFIGDFSYTNYEKRNAGFDPPQTLGDVRTAVTINCILPLGVEAMAKPRSVLIAGHCQSGKHVLANAIFNETRCVLFDISPKITTGKYEGKQGMVLLLALINRMSRILQPSIIFIDGGEKPFYKVVPPKEADIDTKKMAGDLFKGIVKKILPEDRVLVVAITNQPFAAKPGPMKKAFERIILIPRTDYGSLYLYWRQLLMVYHGVDRNFNVSELAYLTVTYPLPAIKAVVEKVLVPERLIQLKFKPLDAHEFIEILLDEPEPIIDKQWIKFEKWFSKTPLGKKRAHLMRIEAENREIAAKLAEKAAKK